ncbi:MAG: nucleoside recognition domain-containing protein [Bacteroidota bacterium]|jgi:spore maturation protein SpmA|nr:spore maturation protein [Prolixibacteraceae bacterium]MDI9564698.1 nucleoside recognition domain-containing protein [Bacteroidota bacterium]HNZ69541.1 nucleoside recognition domain-containing protein [Prolixibacteraceae bacterium]HOC87314.1 nucleoside recognition domain-containing protein [Prolixibacteraceae bacterium]HOF55494.1 nucleoside recognition domain-containing protein [Prolixibacteraceae bacterium]
MALNYLFIFFFLVAFVIGLAKLLFLGDTEVFTAMVNSTFDNAKTGFEISLGLTGVLTLWMGIMKVGEKGGVVNLFSRAIGPFFNKLFPDLGKSHPAYGSIILNIAANMLNLDNAATPVGLQAMREMQETNSKKDTASDPMIMFLVLNTSGLTIIPVTIMVYRAQLGAVNPADVFLPILIATYFSTLVGLVAVSLYQKINLLNKVVLAYLGSLTLLIGALIWYFSTLEQEQITHISALVSNVILFSIIAGFILSGVVKKINVYEAFIEGAIDGFKTAVKIIPYLVAILVAIGVFRASGAMEWLLSGLSWVVAQLGLNTDFIPAMPTAFMKPLSGSGARGMMVDAMTTYGADSFVGKLACIFQGATDTTFYIIAVYFGSVGIKKTRYTVVCGLLADLAGILAAIFLGYLFFH